ncbi:MAG: RNA-binding S4 domain-containing protein [Bacteroidales bacterium]
MAQTEAPRIDKWLWAVRIFKTRTLATEACRNAKVRVEDQPVKPSREIQEGMVISIQTGPIKRTIRVIAPLHNRVGAKLVGQYMEDLTPEEEYQKLEIIKSQSGYRPKRTGRPTKKERRELDEWFGQ